MPDLQVVSEFTPAGDQSQAISSLTQSILSGNHCQTLMGVTGSGKTYTMARIIEQVQRPTLILSHNKTLAAQLYREFKEFFPHNAVEYFVSYYDYYQPEAYVPSRDLYIEKDSSINDEIERMRLSTTTSLMERRDVIVVATVSCIYGIGSPTALQQMRLELDINTGMAPDELARRLIEMQYERNNDILERGAFRVRGDTVDIFPAYLEVAYRIDFDWDRIVAISRIDPLNNSVVQKQDLLVIYPATHFAMPAERIKKAIVTIGEELHDQLEALQRMGKTIEAHRLKSRTEYDLEMLEEMGTCKGIENYSRHLSQREAGEAPDVLIDYFPQNFLTFVDESHVTLSQFRAMYEGDRSRKANLVEFGFRLPSALDNRPLIYNEFEKKIEQVVYVSATPREEEREKSTIVAEQIIRPTGLLDPLIEVRPTEGQMEDLYAEISKRTKKGERTLVTTLTKRMAERLTEYLCSLNLRCRYLHSEIDAFERVEILRDLRAGEFDVLVGINLLREGLDLPEVSFIAILDADKIGFLRSKTSLIQTVGRAARNAAGCVIMYADRMSEAMEETIRETERRRKIQQDYNQKHGITPQTIKKAVRDILERHQDEKKRAEEMSIDMMKASTNLLDPRQKKKLIRALENEMLERSKNMEFEEAAVLRDEIKKLKGEA